MVSKYLQNVDYLLIIFISTHNITITFAFE